MAKDPNRGRGPMNDKWLVGVGASAGGLEALGLLLQNMDPQFAAPVIVAQHLAPHAKSMMVELLARQSKLPVVAAHGGEVPKPGVVYVTPPNFDVEIVDGQICLTIAGEETRPKPSIDGFFRSLARFSGSRAVGIILSGTGTDGAEGCRAVRAAGGVTLAQDDRSAKYDGMPRAAVDTGSVDSIFPPETIASALPEILRDHHTRINYRQIDDQNLLPILNLVREKLGTDFREYKTSTIQRRIAKRMSGLGIETFKDFYELLSNKPHEIDLLAQEMLVSVTSFFRDPEVFGSLAPHLNALVANHRAGSEVRAWVAGCATGEEAYTIAILLLEASERQHKSLNVKVFATDLDHDAIFEGRNGVYATDSVNAVPEAWREKYFDVRGSKVEVIKRLRDCVVFARQDLIQNPPFVKVDLVTCRNVLIYFESDLQKRILETFHYALNPSGLLLLGKSEGVGPLGGFFETLGRAEKLYRKINVPSRSLPPGRLSAAERSVASVVPRRPSGGPSLAEQAYARIFQSHGLAAVVIDEEANVLQILGDVSAYLGFFTGHVESKLPGLLPRNLGVEIPILVRRAKSEGRPVRSRTHKLGAGKNLRRFNMTVTPLREASEDVDTKALFVVTFAAARVKTSLSEPVQDSDLPSRMHELEQELHVTREHLQTVIEELGVSNEELQSVNEELSSTNEELQASSEELETTNEELQSTNEELTTLNEELSIRSSEIKAMNASLENVQNSIGSALVVIDHRMNIVRFNQDALKIFNLSQADVGRPITRVSAHCEIPEFEQRLLTAIGRGQASESIIEMPAGGFQLRVMPSYDDNRSIIGAIILFLDNTGMIRAQEKLAVSDRRMRAIVDGSISIIFIKDTVGRYTMVNRAFLDAFGLPDEAAAIGRTDRELFGDELAAQLRDGDLEVFLKRVASRRSETLLTRDGRRHDLLLNRFPLFDAEGNNPYAVGTIAMDISKQIAAQEALARSEAQFRSIIEDQSVLVVRHRPDGLITFANAPFTAFFGERPEASVGENFYALLEPAQRPGVKVELENLRRDKPLAQYEQRVTNGTGSSARTHWVRWVHRALFAKNGEVSEYQAVGFDVTEARLQTVDLKDKHQLFSEIFANTVDYLSVFVVIDGEFVLESFNRSAEKMLGFTSAKIVGKRLRELLDPVKGAHILANYERCLRLNQAQVFEEEIGTFGGSRVFLTTLVPIPGENGRPRRLAAVSRDISAYKTIENDLRKAKEAAEIASCSKSDFLASMSHELRTPLNVVLGMSQILADTALDPEQNRFVDSIARSGKVLLSLIDDVLDVARIEAGKINLQSVSFAVENVLQEVIELFQHPAAEKGLKLALDMDPDVRKYVVGDPIRLRQVLTNLVGNAIKFTDHGEVAVTARLEAGAEAGHQAFRFTVTDSGIGIAVEDHARLFQRFSQVQSGHSRRFGGTGLGLMISRQLVTMMKGEIGFTSEKGQGSVFWFTVNLPLGKHQARVTGRPEPLAEVKSPRPLKILAVDDNLDSQTVLELLLARLGHQSRLAASGQAAIDFLRDEDFDLVLMDIQMPEMDGFEATAQIRTLGGSRARTPVIALTANAMSGDAEKCFASGMDDYLTKPIDVRALQRLLGKWSDRI